MTTKTRNAAKESSTRGFAPALLLALAIAYPAQAADVLKPAPSPTPAVDEEEKVDVDGIKEKYWARGEQTQMGVVQNRTYSKERKFQLALLGGVSFSDPFLMLEQVGVSFGYHFNEYFAVHLMGWKYFHQDSSAATYFKQELGGVPNTNIPDFYLGGELSGSILYGKLSLVGKAIIYYDMHLLGGCGATKSESGWYVTPHLGIGQQVYVTKWLSIAVDYRLQYYREDILEKAIPTRLGEVRGQRDNWNNTINLGINFLWGFGK